jgi:alkylation response protein AidB-like acyl-CoA dehydrogenase
VPAAGGGLRQDPGVATPETKRWGDDAYFGLGHDFDPSWFLTPEDRALEAEIIEACERVIRPLAIECDRSGDYPRASVDELGRLRLLAMVAPAEYGCRAASHTSVLMATEAIARYGCPSTAVIFMMHLVAVGGLVFRASGNPTIESLLRRIDREALVGTASYTDPETGGHFWYPLTSGAERVEAGWHVRKTSAFTTSSGHAAWYLTQTTSPDFAGDYSDLSVFLLRADEVRGSPGAWDAMGMHGNQSGPVEIDALIPVDRMVGPPGDGARSNDEAIDPLAFLQYAGVYNGIAMACLDVARRHALRRAHTQYGRRIADYATVQDAYGRALCEVQASRVFAYGVARAMDDATDGGSWAMYATDPDAAPRSRFTTWGLEAKVLAADRASRVSDEMLQLCGGRGYTRAGEIERLVRDAKAGWVMAPSNEVSRQIVGRWALLGADAVDWWNQRVDERALHNEIGKMDEAAKRRLIEQLAAGLGQTREGSDR